MYQGVGPQVGLVSEGAVTLRPSASKRSLPGVGSHVTLDNTQMRGKCSVQRAGDVRRLAKGTRFYSNTQIRGQGHQHLGY